MTIDTPTETAARQRATLLFRESQDVLHRRIDRMFAWLMILQWVAGIAAATWISPRTWIGTTSQIHWHVWAAIFLGGAITVFPVFLAWKQPGQTLTRHTIAVAQMLFSALLIHLTGGRIETHFHVFGSLAFLAFYRDWRVLLTATVIVAGDHAARGMFWPQSVFGVLVTSQWRWLEHAGWVLFEDTFLFISIQQGLKDMTDVATRRARLEGINTEIERQVTERSAELQASERRFRTLSTSAPIGIFETDAAGNALYTNPSWQKITGMSLEHSLGEGWKRVLHPEDAVRVIAGWMTAAGEGREYNDEFRFRRASGEDRWVHARSTVIRSESGNVIGHVGTVEDITERKRAEADLARASRELLEASRQAGKAEMATGVLHNVGNVLNSVNVASNCVAESLKKSKAANLGKVAAMLQEHQSDLGKFLTEDAKGKQIPEYLARLAERLTEEQAAVLAELAQLQKNIEHINGIVRMQQSCAKNAGQAETLTVADLVEDSLRMNATGFARHDIRVVKDFKPDITLTVEKHKALQILVNLVTNAKQACVNGDQKERVLTISARNGGDRVRIAVSDTGVGIAPENLDRIFAHGFTTKKDGHGFGLHSSLQAAREMGGTLVVHSDGPGKGATFTLDLPVRSAQSAAENTPAQKQSAG